MSWFVRHPIHNGKIILSDRLHSHFGIDMIIPSEVQRQTIHRIIYEELCHGEINNSSRAVFLDVIDDFSDQGASGVILGCTEIGLLIDQKHTQLPVLDTTVLHAHSLVDFLRSIPSDQNITKEYQKTA